MSPRKLALAIAAGLICFALGIVWARFFGGPPSRDRAPTGEEPLLVFDAGGIQLLPDAELRLELPRGFDAGP